MTTEAVIPGTSVTGKASAEVSPRIPLVVGVAGHRGIRPADESALTKTVHQVFDELARECPNTPITVLSPLAEGADRLVAKVAMERKAALVALLPMPRALFETDFKTDASRTEFERLINSSQRVIETPLPENVSQEEVAKDGEERNARYAAGGAMLNRSCHLLIALWDGEVAAGMGGTGDQVPFMLKGPPPQHQEVWNFLHPPSTGPVAQIYTPRSDTPKHKPGEVIWHFPTDGPWRQGRKELSRRLKQIDQFNVEATGASGDSLLPESAWKQGADTPVARIIDARYQAADRMARAVQNRAKRAYQWLSILGLLALSFYQLDSNHQTHWGGYLTLFALVMAVSIVVYLISKKGRLHERFLDDRALAEVMRVQFFWTIAGVEESVLDYMPLRLHSDLSWLRVSMMDYVNPPPIAQPWQATEMQLLRLAHQYWVQDQRSFFIDRAIKRREQVEWVSTTQTVLIVLGLVAVAVSFLIKRSLGEEQARPTGALGPMPWLVASLLMTALSVGIATIVVARKRISWRRIHGAALLRPPGIFFLLMGLLGAAMVITSVIKILGHPVVEVKQAAFILNAILSIIGPVTAGVIQAYGGHFAFAEHVRRYLTMADLFGRAERALATLLKRHDVANTRELLFHLGHESLSESAEWLIMHRERPIPLIRPKSSVDVIFQTQSTDVMLPNETEGGANRQ